MSPLREADAYNYAKFRSSLTESSHQAVFQDGKTMPVLIRGYEAGKPELYIETENYQFLDPRKLQGFVRLEETPEEKAWQAEEAQKAEAAEAARAQKLKGSNWLETRQEVEAQHRQGAADRYQQNK